MLLLQPLSTAAPSDAEDLCFHNFFPNQNKFIFFIHCYLQLQDSFPFSILLVQLTCFYFYLCSHLFSLNSPMYHWTFRLPLPSSMFLQIFLSRWYFNTTIWYIHFDSKWFLKIENTTIWYSMLECPYDFEESHLKN